MDKVVVDKLTKLLGFDYEQYELRIGKTAIDIITQAVVMPAL